MTAPTAAATSRRPFAEIVALPAEAPPTTAPTAQPWQAPNTTQAAQLEAYRVPTPISNGSGNETQPEQMGGKRAASVHEPESELKEPGSNVPTPPCGIGWEKEIVVGAKDNGTLTQANKDGNAVIADADEKLTESSCKRKRIKFDNLNESYIDILSIREERPERTVLPATSSKLKLKLRNSLGGLKGAVVGHWRDSPVPQLENKHAVIGFIDSRDRLRTRIHPINKKGETISDEYPLPRGSWIIFQGIYFSDHLVGLDHFQVKEYVRMRTAAVEDSDEEIVEQAIFRGRELLKSENPVVAPLVAYGATPLDADATLVAASVDPLYGTRPTRIMVGHWRGSSEADPIDRHAVFGILGQNDMFRVKVVRETRDGRYVDGNFPSSTGALWIHFNQVEFEPHIKTLSRAEIKEYCRVRQHQVDQGESVDERSANELHAADEARFRVTAPAHMNDLRGTTAAQQAEADGASTENDGRASVGHEVRQLRRTAAADTRPARHSLGDIELAGVTVTNSRSRSNKDSTSRRAQSREALSALARRKIDRAQAAQDRATRVANATAATMTTSSQPLINGATSHGLIHQSDDIQRLNHIWAAQESLRLRGGSEDAKVHNGVKYERKGTGPFTGKLVSQGTIVPIDGEEYVEYRVLTRPSFF